jgi:hypothetical protein
MKEVALLQQALSNYERLTGGKATILQGAGKEGTNDIKPDVMVELHHGTKKVQLKAEVKLMALNKSVLGLLKQQMEANGGDLLITRYVPGNLAEAMRRLKLYYLDTAGNMFIDRPGFMLFVQGQKKPDLLEPEPVKLFHSAGLRVLFQLIGFPEDPIMRHPIQMPLRQLADLADVSLGSVHKAMSDLDQLGYILRLNERQKKLINRQELVKRWVEAYGETLRPKLFIGNFRFANEQARQNWRLIKLNNSKTRWGGEPAAASYTRHIQPNRFTLYTTESQGELMRNYRLMPQAEGEIEVLIYPAKKMTNEPYHGQFNCVPPLLTYADLMTTTDPRNHETAKMLYHDYLHYLA